MAHSRLSQLMYLSWKIQRTKKVSRAKALQSAWVIIQNEDVVVFQLVKKHSHTHYVNKVEPTTLTLFKHL
jgi:hypothetical protein